MAGVINPSVVQFTAPTRYVDNSQIPANQIRRFEYGFAQTPQAAQATRSYPRITQDTDFTATGDGRQFGPIPQDLAYGQWYGSARTVSVDGAVSDWGNEVPFEVQPKKPAPISDFSAQ